MCLPHLNSGEICFTYLMAEWLHTFFLFYNYAQEICLFLPMYLFIQLFLSVWIHGDLFYTLGYNKILFILFAPIFPDLVTGTSFSWLLGLFDLPPSLWVSFLLLLSLSIYLFSDTTRYSRFIWYISWPFPRISHVSKDQETKIWALGMLVATRVLLSMGSPSCQRREIYVCTLIYRCIYM